MPLALCGDPTHLAQHGPGGRLHLANVFQNDPNETTTCQPSVQPPARVGMGEWAGRQHDWTRDKEKREGKGASGWHQPFLPLGAPPANAIAPKALFCVSHTNFVVWCSSKQFEHLTFSFSNLTIPESSFSRAR
jgi:hypothetical protein